MGVLINSLTKNPNLIFLWTEGRGVGGRTGPGEGKVNIFTN